MSVNPGIMSGVSIDPSTVSDPETRAWLEGALANPAFAFSLLPLGQQKDATHEAAVDAALRFCADPAGFAGDDGRPDPMQAFYGLGHLSHTRDLPTFALLVICSGVLDEETARDLAVFAWRVPEWPEGANTDVWRETWARVGFCSDMDGVEPPTSPVTVYRGAVPRFKRGMAWTGDLDRARWFARRFGPSGTFSRGRVYVATVPPERVFARIEGRGEDEWVVDTRRLAIRTLEIPEPKEQTS